MEETSSEKERKLLMLIKKESKLDKFPASVDIKNLKLLANIKSSIYFSDSNNIKTPFFKLKSKVKKLFFNLTFNTLERYINKQQSFNNLLVGFIEKLMEENKLLKKKLDDKNS